jgi:FSR family fosmidomycin resistance protein-like MFS transporter
MPITLWAAARLMPGGKGFAFGLLTFGLFLGFLPTWLGWPSTLTQPWAMALAALLSAVLLLAGLKGEKIKCS